MTKFITMLAGGTSCLLLGLAFGMHTVLEAVLTFVIGVIFAAVLINFD